MDVVDVGFFFSSPTVNRCVETLVTTGGGRSILRSSSIGRALNFGSTTSCVFEVVFLVVDFEVVLLLDDLVVLLRVEDLDVEDFLVVVTVTVVVVVVFVFNEVKVS